MKRTLSIQTSVIITIALLLAFIILGVRQQTRIRTLHEERESLERNLAAARAPSRTGPGVRVRTRNDKSAEARRAMSELASLSTEENEGEIDWNRRADLADRIQAMNAASLREAVAWILEADELDPAFRQSLLYYFLNRLAENHPIDVIDRITRLEADPPTWLEEFQFPTVLQHAAGRWAAMQPEAAWEWVQERRRGLDERNSALWRSPVFRSIGRHYPELLLRLADEEEIDGGRFLVWQGQTADEKLAAFTALRQWHAKDPEGSAAIGKAVREIMLHRPHGHPVAFAESIGWIERAGLTPEDIRFLSDPSTLDLSSYIDPVETGKWIDWLYRTFPEDWLRGRIDGLFEDHRTGDAARAWLADQPEDRTQRIRGNQNAEP